MYDRTLQLDLSVVFVRQARKNLAELGRERENLADLVPLAKDQVVPGSSRPRARLYYFTDLLLP